METPRGTEKKVWSRSRGEGVLYPSQITKKSSCHDNNWSSPGSQSRHIWLPTWELAKCDACLDLPRPAACCWLAENHQLHATCHMPPLAAWKCLWQWFIQRACALVDPKFQWKQTLPLPSFVCATKCHNMRWQGNSSLRAFNGNASPPQTQGPRRTELVPSVWRESIHKVRVSSATRTWSICQRFVPNFIALRALPCLSTVNWNW